MANEHFEESKAAARDIKDTIKEGATQVGSDVRRTAKDARGAARDVADATETAAPGVLDAAKEKADDLRAQAQDVIGDIYEETIEAIRERPVAAVAIAALAGAVLALLARRASS